MISTNPPTSDKEYFTFSSQTWGMPNMERVGKFSFANRLNDIIPLLSDNWLGESKKQMKKTLKDKILEIVPATCDS